MKKSDASLILSKIDPIESISVFIMGMPQISCSGTCRSVAVWLDMTEISNDADVFYISAKNFNTEPIKSDRPTISYFCLVNMQPNARALKQLTNWQTWLKDLKNNPNATDIRLNFDPNAEFIPIF